MIKILHQLPPSGMQIRDITAEWLERVCHDVVIEPPLQPLTGENVVPATANRQDDARADIHARGFCMGSPAEWLF